MARQFLNIFDKKKLNLSELSVKYFLKKKRVNSRFNNQDYKLTGVQFNGGISKI